MSETGELRKRKREKQLTSKKNDGKTQKMVEKRKRKKVTEM